MFDGFWPRPSRSSTGKWRTAVGGSLRDRLIATARNAEKLQDLAQSHLQQVHTLSLDVTAPDNIRSAIAEAKNAFGRIDVLVNNAGYGTMGALEEASDRENCYL